MKVYHCANPDENPIPRWMTNKKDQQPQVPVELDPVQQFKNNPDAFFPTFIKR